MVKRIELTQFRSYEKRVLDLGQVTVIKGVNGAGKSNLMEAIYLLAVGKSFRANVESEMIRYGSNIARVKAEADDELEIILTDGTMDGTRKKYLINGVAKRGLDFVGRIRAVLFGPGDMELISGSPSLRRKYLDFVIGQKDREYRRNLISYEKGLRQRNRLLDLIREGKAGRHQLFFWDKLLIKNGQYITEKRADYLQKLGRNGYEAEYDKSVISEARIKQYENEEVAAGSTLVGPHRDDFWIKLEGRNVDSYGSRGEQRMGVLWLKRGERNYLTEEGKRPILLLDDVFSELDMKHRLEVVQMVEEQVTAGGQVIMTTAEPESIETWVGKRNWDIIDLGDK